MPSDLKSLGRRLGHHETAVASAYGEALRIDQAMAHGQMGQFDITVDAEFFKNSIAIGIDGFNTDE